MGSHVSVTCQLCSITLVTNITVKACFSRILLEMQLKKFGCLKLGLAKVTVLHTQKFPPRVL